MIAVSSANHSVGFESVNLIWSVSRQPHHRTSGCLDARRVSLDAALGAK